MLFASLILLTLQEVMQVPKMNKCSIVVTTVLWLNVASMAAIRSLTTLKSRSQSLSNRSTYCVLKSTIAHKYVRWSVKLWIRSIATSHTISTVFFNNMTAITAVYNVNIGNIIFTSNAFSSVQSCGVVSLKSYLLIYYRLMLWDWDDTSWNSKTFWSWLWSHWWSAGFVSRKTWTFWSGHRPLESVWLIWSLSFWWEDIHFLVGASVWCFTAS